MGLGSPTVDEADPVISPTRSLELSSVDISGGFPLLRISWLNKGTAFSQEERIERHLEGLLPPAIETLVEQRDRLLLQLSEEPSDLHRNTLLTSVLGTNSTLFYKAVVDRVEQLAPIVYTPTIGEACQKWDVNFREPVGMYVSAFRHRGRFAEVLRNWPVSDVQIAVVTDGSRILGLGDLGVNGIGIPIGKISLYVAGAGLHPERSLPIAIDAGCDREELREHPQYLGERRGRLADDEYYEVISEFVAAFREVFPRAVLQFEDFATPRAFGILERHRASLPSFNDDIHGTGAVVAAGFVNGMRAQGTVLSEARVLFYGAGSSAVGVAQSICRAIDHEGRAPGEDEESGDPATSQTESETARRAIYLIDSKGLVTNHRGDELPAHKKLFARGEDVPNLRGLVEAIEHIKPHALIGLSGSGPAWGRDVVDALIRNHPRPLIFPLSNPTSRAEISAEDALTWSDGRALFAAGSPFKPVTLGDRVIVPGQANNVLVFPGIGAGAVLSKASAVTDSMLSAATLAVAESVRPEEFDIGKLYPSIDRLREISFKVAAAVARTAWQQGVSALKSEPADWHQFVVDNAWWPDDDSRVSAGF